MLIIYFILFFCVGKHLISIKTFCCVHLILIFNKNEKNIWIPLFPKYPTNNLEALVSHSPTPLQFSKEQNKSLRNIINPPKMSSPFLITWTLSTHYQLTSSPFPAAVLHFLHKRKRLRIYTSVLFSHQTLTF